MRQVGPIIRRFRYQLIRNYTLLNKNWGLRRIGYLLHRVYCLATCRGEETTATVNILPNLTLLRTPDLMARRTTIANLGANPATIFEEGKIIAIIAAGESRELQLGGRFIIEAKCDAGQTTTLEITTQRRCLCGDTYYPPHGYGQAVEPIGGDLI